MVEIDEVLSDGKSGTLRKIHSRSTRTNRSTEWMFYSAGRLPVFREMDSSKAVILVAPGSEKCRPIHASVCGKYVSVLVLNQVAAQFGLDGFGSSAF